MALARVIPKVDLSFIDHPEGRATLVVYFCGCPHHCKGCHSKDLQDAHYYKCVDITVEKLFNNIKTALEVGSGMVNALTFLGGEPLLYSKFLEQLCEKLKKDFPSIEIILYTGFLFEVVPNNLKKYLDYVIDGKFEIDKKTSGFPASYNQKIWYKDGNVWKDYTNKLKTY